MTTAQLYAIRDYSSAVLLIAFGIWTLAAVDYAMGWVWLGAGLGVLALRVAEDVGLVVGQ